MNLSSLQDECGRLLADANHSRWSTDVLTTRLNIAQVQVQSDTNAVKTQETLTPVANQQSLSVSLLTMEVLNGTKTLTSGEVRPLPGITLYELDLKYPNWRQWTAGEPLLFYWDATANAINLVPKPDSANAITNGITLWESRFPASMSLSTDVPFDGNVGMYNFHLAPVHWTVAQCWMDDGSPESLGKSKFHKSDDMEKPGLYERQIKRINEKFDVSEAVDSHITFIPEGGRVGSWGTPSKSFPLG